MNRFVRMFENRKGQQLVEFLLVAPFIVIIFGVLTEFAYALSLNLILNQGLRIATASIYSEIRPAMTVSQVSDAVEAKLTNYMASNKAPVNSDNKLTVEYAIVGDNTFFIATYTYVSAFTLPNVYFHILPEKFDFSTVSVVPTAFIKTNNYSSISSEQLDKIWSGGASFLSLDKFDAGKRGIMKVSNNLSKGSPTDKASSQKILFLFNLQAPVVGESPLLLYETSTWGGQHLSPDPENIYYYFNLESGMVYSYNVSTALYDKDPVGSIGSVMSSYPNLTNIIIFSDDKGGYVCDNSTELAADSQKCLIKGMLSLCTGIASLGNYDNIHNDKPIFVSSSSYKVDTYGSRVVAHWNSPGWTTVIQNLMSQFPLESKNYDFGTKVAAP